MSYAYNEYYLSDAMQNLGEMTEYAHDACRVDPDRALRYFVISGYSDRFGTGDPCVVSGRSGTELFCDCAEKCGAGREKWPPAIIKYTTEEYYWMGYILAYFQWKTNRPFASIVDVIKSDDLLQMYPALHTASDEKAIEVIDELYRSRSQLNRLQEYRKRIGMTQAELSEAAGVNIRTLQQYEVGTKSLNKAAAESIISLAHVLNCRVEELIS